MTEKTAWISITHKTPKLGVSISNGFMWESERVLACGPSYGVGIACYYASEGLKDFWWWKNRHGEKLEGITHWMPLPAPPRSE